MKDMQILYWHHRILWARRKTTTAENQITHSQCDTQIELSNLTHGTQTVRQDMQLISSHHPQLWATCSSPERVTTEEPAIQARCSQRRRIVWTWRNQNPPHLTLSASTTLLRQTYDTWNRCLLILSWPHTPTLKARIHGRVNRISVSAIK